MKLGGRRLVRRFIFLAAAGILVAVLTACTGKGGGYLPPSAGFSGQAPFGFTFSCEDAGGINPSTGKLSIELAYADKGTSLIGSSFGIHGIVDKIDPVLESAICSGQEPPPGGNELIFLGRHWLTSGSPSGFPTTCPKRETETTPLCRFEVIVRDNDDNYKPSKGDFFSITLSSATELTSELDPATVFYTRSGVLAGGNLTVK
jgi:predicted small lipoprotein YifL